MTQRTTNEIARVDATGHVKPLVLMLDESVHAAGVKCGDSTCPCFEDDTFAPLVISPAFQARMDSLLIEESAHERMMRASFSTPPFSLLK